MSNKIKPKFNKVLPENAKYYFDPASDDQFKATHPVGYRLLVFCGISAFMLPLVLYLVLTQAVFPTPNSAWMVLGGAGAFIVGIGFFNLVAAWIGQYLGHLVTGLCIVTGTLMVGASVLLLYHKTLYARFDEQMVTYYFVNLLFMCLPALYYAAFRFSLGRWLRMRIGKEFKKPKKGRRNFWWYEGINNQYDMGFLFHINRLFTIFFPINFILHLLLGWIKVLSIPITALFVLICVLCATMSLFSSIQYNKEVYGKPFVLLAPSPNKGLDSFIFDLCIAALPLGLAYANLIQIAKLWNLPWHLTLG